MNALSHSTLTLTLTRTLTLTLALTLALTNPTKRTTACTYNIPFAYLLQAHRY